MSKLYRLDFDKIDIDELKNILDDKDSSLDDLNAVLKVKETQLIQSKTGKVYYKSQYDSMKKYYQEHKDELRKKTKERYLNDDTYRLKNLTRARLRYHLNKKIKQKEEENKKKDELSDCSIESEVELNDEYETKEEESEEEI